MKRFRIQTLIISVILALTVSTVYGNSDELSHAISGLKILAKMLPDLIQMPTETERQGWKMSSWICRSPQA